jgi:hypothetical protein
MPKALSRIFARTLLALVTSSVCPFLSSQPARAQDNYEIQVYGSETMAPRTLLAELHSNFAVEGSSEPEFGVQPTQH